MQQTAIQQTWLSNNLNLSNLPASTTASSEARRASEPCHTMTDRKSPPPRPASVTLSPLKGTLNSSELHPNQAVILDEVGEGEMVENKLVIPDEMVRYLNQVADQTGETAMSWSDNGQKPLGSPSFGMLPSPSSLNQMIPSPGSLNQIMHSPNPRTMMQSPAGNINQMMPSPSANMSQMISSPAGNLNQMMQSPAPNMNQMMPSPATNMNQMMPSPATNMNHMNQMMPSPAPNMNQMMPSPASTMNQMMPSPAANMNQMMPSPATNMNQMMHSPAGNMNHMNQVMQSPSNMNQTMHSPGYQVMHSPANFNNIQNPMLSPAPSMNQMGSNPSMRCQQVVTQNCHGMPNGGMMQQMNNQSMNGCYDRSNHGNCYNNQHWENNCQNPNMMQQNHHGMCGRNQDQRQIPSNNYMSSAMSTVSNCTNHNNYQLNNQNGYTNCQNKMNNYSNCNTYQPMQSPGYNCMSNMAEPLPSPAMATPAPVDVMNQPQQAQMSRPCTHYCYPTPPYTNQCVSNPQSCNNCQNCRKPNYNQQTKCYRNGESSEIQCKDISQSQTSPGITNNGTTMLGMRQDTYQRTLEYVQNCQSWVNNSDMVSSSTHPLKCVEKTTSNMVVGDMTSSLSSLLEENRYLQMIQ